MSWKGSASGVSALIKSKPWRLAIAMVLFFLAAEESAAKCPLVLYEIRGKIQHGTASGSLSGREIFGFFDDYRYAIGEHSSRPSKAITNSQGQFILRGTFDSYVEYGWWGHNCSGLPERLEVVIISNGAIERLEFARGKFTILRGKGQQVIVLPTIRLDD